MRVESKIQEKKIKLIKKGEFVEDKAVDILFLYRDNKNNTYMLFVQ